MTKYQRDVVSGERDMGGTMRLGLYPAKLLEGSVVAEAYGQPYIDERHRHRQALEDDLHLRNGAIPGTDIPLL